MKTKIMIRNGVKVRKIGDIGRAHSKTYETIENQKNIDFCLNCTALKCRGYCTKLLEERRKNAKIETVTK